MGALSQPVVMQYARSKGSRWVPGVARRVDDETQPLEAPGDERRSGHVGPAVEEVREDRPGQRAEGEGRQEPFDHGAGLNLEAVVRARERRQGEDRGVADELHQVVLHHGLGLDVVLPEGRDGAAPDQGRRLVEGAVPDPVRQPGEEARRVVAEEEPRDDHGVAVPPRRHAGKAERQQGRVPCEHAGRQRLEGPVAGRRGDVRSFALPPHGRTPSVRVR